MRTRTASCFACSLSLFTGLTQAQVIQPPPDPLQPGVWNAIGLTNDQSTNIALARIAMLRTTGELVLPELPEPSDTPFPIPPGATFNMGLDLPASGPGSAGSYLAFYPTGLTAVRRVDVGHPDPTFPVLHAFPSNVHLGNWSYLVSAASGSMSGSWRIANSSPTPRKLGMADTIAVYPPGSSTSMIVKSLEGLVVPANRTIEVELPLDGLPKAPYDIAVTLHDPVLGTLVRRAGMHVFDQDEVSVSIPPGTLHLPGGTVVPAGGQLPAYLRYSQALPVESPPLFGLLIGFAPGSMSAGLNPAIPLAADPLVMASVTGLGGLLPMNVGTMFQVPMPCLCTGSYFRSPDLSIVHPSTTALNGIPLRIAAVLYVPGHGPSASQAMPLRFE